MAFGFLKKIPGVLFSGLKKVDTVGDFIDDKVPFGKNLLLVIPVAGPYIKLALDEVDFAEKAISGPGHGAQKMNIALRRLQNSLSQAGHDLPLTELGRLIEGAVSIRRGEATVFEDPEDAPEDTPVVISDQADGASSDDAPESD